MLALFACYNIMLQMLLACSVLDAVLDVSVVMEVNINKEAV